MAIHETNFKTHCKGFERLSDLNGFVPEPGDEPEDFRWEESAEWHEDAWEDHLDECYEKTIEFRLDAEDVDDRIVYDGARTARLLYDGEAGTFAVGYLPGMAFDSIKYEFSLDAALSLIEAGEWDVLDEVREIGEPIPGLVREVEGYLSAIDEVVEYLPDENKLESWLDSAKAADLRRRHGKRTVELAMKRKYEEA